MHVIGIVGGVASGKSLVARHFESLGAGVLDADQTGHEVLKTPDVEAAARARWGEKIFGGDGRIDRAKLATIVFAPPPQGPQEREYLEQLTHPEIRRRLEEQLKALAAEGRRAVVLDAAILVEAGWKKLCDTLLFVDAPRPLRLARAVGRGWREEDFAAREGVQESLHWKQRRADVTIDNSGSPEFTRAQIELFWRTLLG